MRIKCSKCGGHLFFIHTPPQGTRRGLRYVYLICENCRKTFRVHFGMMPSVDSKGVLLDVASYEEYVKEPKEVEHIDGK